MGTDNGSEQEVAIAAATMSRYNSDADAAPRTVPIFSIPADQAQAQPSRTSTPIDMHKYGSASRLNEQYTLQSSFSKSSRKDLNVNGLSLQPPVNSQYIPAPLSPRRPLSPAKPTETPESPTRNDLLSTNRANLPPRVSSGQGHVRGNSHESISWLAPIDESGGSSASSVHSRTSSRGLRRKYIRNANGDTEAEFDAALDDAIEAAYDDGYEPMDPDESLNYEEDGEQVIANALRKVELARERVRATEQEALALATERERRLREELEQMEREEAGEQGGGFFDGNDSDEDERMLEEMTTGYAIEEFAFGIKPKTRVPPRESDSSEFTSRTWHSSMASNPPTATTVLSTVSENTIKPGLSKGFTAAIPPPPTQSLPQLPPSRPGTANSAGKDRDSVRDRRLSGQNAKQLKIETAKITAASNIPSTTLPSAQPKTAGYIVQQRQALSAGPNRPPFGKQIPSPAPGISPSEPPPPTPPLPQGSFLDGDKRSGSPSVPKQSLRKNFSSSSLRSMRSKNMSVTAFHDDASDMSPGTPMSNQFGAASKVPALPTSIPTPVIQSFKERTAAGSVGGFYLFDGDFHSPDTPGSPSALAVDGPVPLEPCPTEAMLRPFWLMRCLYQTLAHPRGGYVSNKLFVPRDVWKTKGVKLKNIEEKISNCDLLTAALGRLSRVDTCDADATLEEMQALEGVLEQVQTALTRRLGSEVGVHSTSVLFKDASTPDGDSAGNSGRSGSVSGKPSSFSWRRLRPKNSSAGLGNSYNGGDRKGSLAEGTTGKDGPTMPTLPMTSHPTSKPSRRDVSSLQFSGPNANYMSALARLFDAAQAIGEFHLYHMTKGSKH